MAEMHSDAIRFRARTPTTGTKAFMLAGGSMGLWNVFSASSSMHGRMRLDIIALVHCIFRVDSADCGQFSLILGFERFRLNFQVNFGKKAT